MRRLQDAGEVREAAELLRRVLEAVERGELVASPGMVLHLRGAVGAPELVGGAGAVSRWCRDRKPHGCDQVRDSALW